MKKIAIITFLYDYPEYYKPIFQDKLLNDFDEHDYYVLRFDSVKLGIHDRSYYYKFTYYRIHKFYDFLIRKIVDKYDYFILLDATDVAYVGNITNITNIMEYYNTDILFGAEKNLWPPTSVSSLYDSINLNSEYKFLNAGVHCAKPKVYLDKLKQIISRGLTELCDQGNWQIEYLTSNGIKLDSERKLVFNTFLGKNDVIVTGTDIKINGYQPIFVHDNGGFNIDTIKLVDYYK